MASLGQTETSAANVSRATATENAFRSRSVSGSQNTRVMSQDDVIEHKKPTNPLVTVVDMQSLFLAILY